MPATVAAVAGASLPNVDGISLLPLLTGTNVPWRTEVLLEHQQGGALDPVPSFCGVRTATRKFVRYATGEVELYNLTDDKYEVLNRSNRPAYAADVATLAARTRTLCSPPPPGYVV